MINGFWKKSHTVSMCVVAAGVQYFAAPLLIIRQKEGRRNGKHQY